ncbi:Glycosyltransferase afumC (Fumihopaside A biosynthesis cluster protein C) [Durusdinium trenchii]|uniref:Glycosyltransferase afumC (Fumihopaside A biosynthesis cluster protein C) n=1 Tax=Durusdinium trenchii TaxID=1381693 RepID=A0ABP0MT18_9DINO
MAVKPYLSEAMVPPLQRLLCATDLLVKEDTTMSEILRLLGLQLRVGAWPFWPASTPDGSFQDRRRRALEEQPGFVYSGQALPADADLWSKDELQSFIATGGFIQPRRRRLRLPRDAVPRTAAPQLREWLEIPLDQGDLSIPSEDAPKVIWMYWAQGSKQLNGFRRLCVHTWQVQNPDWKIKILEKETVARFIEPSELPRCYEELPAAQQSDALRLALLAKYGGVYTDVATICLRPLEDWLWGSMSDGTLEQGLGAWYLACFGMEPGVSKEYVENWFLAARANHPLVLAWRDLYNTGWEGVRTRHDYPLQPLFRDVDLSHISIAEHRDWLLMHVCFKKLIDEDAGLRRIWAEEMTLLKADEGALAWMADVDADRPEDAVRLWLGQDVAWTSRQLELAPMLKFVGDAAQALQWQPDEHLVDRENCLTQASGRLVGVEEEILFKKDVRFIGSIRFVGQASVGIFGLTTWARKRCWRAKHSLNRQGESLVGAMRKQLLGPPV